VAVSSHDTHEYSTSDSSSSIEKAALLLTPSSKLADAAAIGAATCQDDLGRIVEKILENRPVVPFPSPSSPCAKRKEIEDADATLRSHLLLRSRPALRALLSACDASRAEAHLEDIYDTTVLYAAETRDNANCALEEWTEDLRLELVKAKDEGIVDVNTVVDAGLLRLQAELDTAEETCARIMQELEDFRNEMLDRSNGGRSGEVEKEESERKRELRKRELLLRDREIEVGEREKDMTSRERITAQREAEVSKRELDVGKREMEMYNKEKELAEKGIEAKTKTSASRIVR
jgi:hypothetical protein